MSAAPQSRLELWLYSLDGVLLAATIVGLFALVCVACAIPSIVRRAEPTTTTTRAVSSSRKSGRVSTRRP